VGILKQGKKGVRVGAGVEKYRENDITIASVKRTNCKNEKAEVPIQLPGWRIQIMVGAQ